MGDLNAKQQRFVAEYLKDLNATQAAIRAGYSAKTASVQAYALLRNPHVAAEVAAGAKNRAEKAEISAQVVLEEMRRIGLADVGEAFDTEGRLKPLADMPLDVRRAISGVEIEELYDGRGEERVKVGRLVKVKFWDKNKGLEMLGKYLKLFVEKHEHTFPDLTDEQRRAAIDELFGAVAAREGGR